MKYTYELSISPEKEEALYSILYKKLGLKESDCKSMEILKKSIDARKKPDIFYKYSFLLEFQNREIEKRVLKRGVKSATERVVYAWPLYDRNKFANYEEALTELKEENLKTEDSVNRPVIVGFGPAGIFAALYLARAGLCPIVLERGAEMSERIQAVKSFHNGGELNLNTNVQFGEGGAGTFSDGKLNTGVKDKSGRNRAVLETFHEFGAPEEIMYDGRAHIGTDVIRKVVVNIRKEIERLGGEIRFNTQFEKPDVKDGKLSGLWVKPSVNSADYAVNNTRNNTSEITVSKQIFSDTGTEYLPCENMILAIGHSARDTYEMLHSMDFSMEAKSFAVGFRVIHNAEFINECQYGEGYKEKYPNLPAAYYKLAYTTSSGRNVYSFCMCPGGYVVNASSEKDRLAVNGMSNAARDGAYSNAAMVMNVGPDDFGSDDILAGMRYQRRLEETAFRLGEGAIPVQFYKDFEKAVNTGSNAINKYLNSAVYGAVKEADLTALFSDSMNQSFVEGMQHYNNSMKGYADSNPLLCGIESRTSAPVRILRNEMLQAFTVKGIYPCGEGAGYAGGITSAAIDGLKCAEMLLREYKEIG